MNCCSIPSSLEIVDWFCKKANTLNKEFGEPQIQHLLFLSQLHFVLKFGQLLYPSLFVCGQSGFYNPTIRTIMKFGLPLMETTKFDSEIEKFLNLIWQKYSLFSETELTSFVLSLDCWKNSYKKDAETIINPMALVDSFAETLHHTKRKNFQSPKSKIMLSQNGPVKVSAWQPRKLSSSKDVLVSKHLSNSLLLSVQQMQCIHSMERIYISYVVHYRYNSQNKKK